MPRIELYEVGPRDGLQNEKALIATDQKIALVNLLSAAGLAHIECASFVSPKWVPQMADSAAVMSGIRRKEGVTYSALVPNERGLAAARAAGVDEVAVFASASEGFSKANINATIAESLARFAPVVTTAREAGLPVRGYVSCVAGCPYDGDVPPSNVLTVAQALLDMGCREISLGDTIGAGTPATIDRLLHAVTQNIPADKLAGHFHDTDGQALANIDVAIGYGIETFDTAVGGLGGCPYAPGAPGNVATEAVMCHLADQGFDTGLDPEAVVKAATFARSLKGANDA